MRLGKRNAGEVGEEGLGGKEAGKREGDRKEAQNGKSKNERQIRRGTAVKRRLLHLQARRGIVS